MANPSPQKSTTVRAFSVDRIALTRRAFRFLERYAPGIGSRWAERLWCSLPPGPAKPAIPLTERGERSTLRLRLTNATGSRDTSIAVESWGTGPATVYLLHGWGGYRGQLGAFVSPLVAAGFRVISLDTPSHGESAPGLFGPNRSLLPEFADALAAAVETFGPAHAVVAHSLGSAGAGLAVLDGLAVDRLVFIAPMPDPIAYSHGFTAHFGFGERIRTGLLRRLEARTGRSMSDFSITSRAARAAGLPPLLVIHDHDDKEIPFGQGRAVAESWTGAELVDTRGLGHRRILRDPEVIGLVAGFLAAERAEPAVAAAASGS